MEKQKKLVVLGAGESGVGAAILGKKQGFNVFVSDFGSVKQEYRELLDKYELEWEEKKHSEARILDADLVVKSPGIPDKAPLLVQLNGKKIPIISEIEFAGRYTNSKIICITGSNGKTTTTLLIYHLLKNAGVKVGLAGNVGKSFARQVAEEDFDVYVIEISSFQLDGMYNFRANVAILLNITPDHLDRYDYKMENYVESKFRITQNQESSDYFIYCADDPVLQQEMKLREIIAKVLPFGYEPLDGAGAGMNDQDELEIEVDQNRFKMSIYDLALQGKHNVYNSMAAGIAAKALNIKNEVIRESLSNFKGVEHRLETFLSVRGVEFINDSKATNVNSVWYALESTHKPIVWIAGGVDKGNDYSILYDLVKNKVKALVCLGVDNSKLHDAFIDKIDCIVETNSMEEAVKQSFLLAEKDDVVLLSPACASFDLFQNYEERGRQFKNAVRKL